MEKKCIYCSYRYHDGFCMQHCYYVSNDGTCPKWTDKPIDFDYNRIYRLCKEYIDICEMYNEGETLKSKYPSEKSLNLGFNTLQFFLNCCLNDLHREMSLWKTRK